MVISNSIYLTYFLHHLHAFVVIVFVFVVVVVVLAEMPRPEPRYLEEIAEERVVGGEVARPNAWPWQVN